MASMTKYRKVFISVLVSVIGFFSEFALAELPVNPTAKNSLAANSATVPVNQPAVAQVVWVKGSAKAISADKRSRNLQRRGLIYELDTLKTDAGSSAQLIFTDGGLLSISSNSVIQVDKYKYEKNIPASENTSIIEVAKGGFRTLTGAIAKANPEGFKINTPVATIGVRGTGLTANFSQADGLQIQADVGKVYVKNNKGVLDLSADDPKKRYVDVLKIDVAPKRLPKAPANLSRIAKGIPLVRVPVPKFGNTNNQYSAPVNRSNSSGTAVDSTSSGSGATSTAPAGSSSSSGFCIQ